LLARQVRDSHQSTLIACLLTINQWTDVVNRGRGLLISFHTAPADIIDSMSTRLQRLMLRSINIWPPFLGAGIRVKWSSDHKSVLVRMKLRSWNRNYVGTHYGGSLYSMTDPFYMLMLMENLGPGYIVWDKAASIRFRKPGKGTVEAQFRLTDEQLDDIRARLTTQEKYDAAFAVEVKDKAGDVVAEVQKVIHVRRK
jgi:hypothetical protein